ncbi:hypothetical protein, partial [Enterococcus durans]|uniref:hypothetical protein n=1 Tax=Enterococcus durans TaxID=53345 RepID=UPI001C61142F
TKVFLTFFPHIHSFLLFPLFIHYVPTTPNNSQKDILDGKASLYFSNVLHCPNDLLDETSEIWLFIV